MSGMVSSQGYEDMPGLYIRNTTGGGTFVEQARKALLKLRSKSRGKRLLELISTLCHEKNVPITIEPAIGFYGQTGPGWSESDNLVRWNTKTQPKQSGNEDQLNDIPTFIIPPEAGDVFRLYASEALKGTKYEGL